MPYPLEKSQALDVLGRVPHTLYAHARRSPEEGV